ncbi:MAG TPA: redox-sensing transcriptional repressor Rex [Thermoanaerobaculia bacterium]|nr:redox-sensing transcriptional repressor Rex [Thermoanaerobaculia bacterium]
MQTNEPVPEATSHRLSLLLRSLRDLEAAGVHTASSYDIAARFSLNSAQIRKDLAQFGEFGVRGVGYRVGELKTHLKVLMGLDVTRALGIAGAGNLGQALADSRNFNAEGFRVAALFDVDGRKIGGRSRTGVPIRDIQALESSVKELRIEIGILAVPGEGAIPLARRMAAAGVGALLNFAPVTVPALPGMVVKNVDLTFFLENLSFQLAVTT